jgi:hypothetical protein
MLPHEYNAAVAVFTRTIEDFLEQWEGKFKPDSSELLAMAEVFINISQTLRQKALERL